MTCVAWDGKTLAADGRMCLKSHITADNLQKIHKLNNVRYIGDTLLYIGVAGACSHFDLLLDYMHSEDFPRANIKHGVDAIIVGNAFVYLLEEDNNYLIRFPRKTKLAEGSGGVFAKSGMALGMGAVQAIRFAMKFDSATGGKIQAAELP